MKKIITANELRLTDENGNIRALLTATENGTDLIFSDDKGNPQFKVTSAGNGLTALNMYDKNGQEKIEISLDDKGTHIHLSGTDKQESYLFLKDSGAAGLVLTDQKGNRRLEAKISPDAAPAVTIYTQNGEAKTL